MGKRYVVAVALIALLGAVQVGRLAARWIEEPVPEAARNRVALEGGWTDDLSQDYASASEVRRGGSPYQPTARLLDLHVGEGWRGYHWVPDGQVNPHTPLHIVLMTPITALRYADARVVWLIANALMFALAFGWFARSNGTSRWFAAMVGLASLLIPTVYRHLQLGQSHAVLLLLFVGAWRALKRDRDAGAGIALGLATALRVIPLVLLLPLLRQRRFRAAAWHAGSALAFTVVGVGLAGGTSLGDFLRTAGGDNVSFWRSAPMNSSLSALPYRWLTENPWGYGIANLPALAAVAGALLTLAALVAAWRSPARGTSDLFWATVPWMLLASPLFWEHYLVLAIPAAALALRTRLRSSGIATKLAMIAGALVLLGEPPGLSGLVSGISAPEQLLGYALPLYSMLVLGLSDWLAQPARSSVTPAAETTSA